MKEFVEFIAKHLVDQPECVSIVEECTDNRVVLKVSVAPPDVGKIIGKQGRTAFAIRVLASAVGKRGGKKVVVDVIG